MSTVFNLKCRLQAAEERLRVSQLRSIMRELDRELSGLQDIIAEAKRLLVEQAAQAASQGKQRGSNGHH